MDRIPTARPSWTDEMRDAAVATLDSIHWVKAQKVESLAKNLPSIVEHYTRPHAKMGHLHFGLLLGWQGLEKETK